ncbi:MAG: SMP-30/gluconolactonase/LRE family protein [Akkermansiaceae bacterium]|nr:SMP-30/gluconolactonase/LRE family protein [Akkermansiaceae bacterium]
MRVITFLALATISSVAQDHGIFVKGSAWSTVTQGHQFAEGMAFDSAGNLVFTDVPRKQLFRVDAKTGKKTLLDGETGATNGIAVGPGGTLYGCAGGDRKIYAWDMTTWKRSTVAEGPHSNDIAVRKDGTIFFTDPQTQSVWRVTAGERKLEKAAALEWNPNGITLSRDHETLYVAEFFSGNIHGFAIAADNSLGKDTIAFKLETPADNKGHLDGMMIHHDGRVLSGTKLGLQVAPPADDKAPQGKSVVVPIPDNLPRCNYVRISPDHKWLYAAHAKAILRRELDPAFARP